MVGVIEPDAHDLARPGYRGANPAARLRQPAAADGRRRLTQAVTGKECRPDVSHNVRQIAHHAVGIQRSRPLGPWLSDAHELHPRLPTLRAPADSAVAVQAEPLGYWYLRSDSGRSVAENPGALGTR